LEKQEKRRTGEMKKIPKHNSGSQPNALIDVHFIRMETGIRYLKASLLDTCQQSAGKALPPGKSRKEKYGEKPERSKAALLCNRFEPEAIGLPQSQRQREKSSQDAAILNI